MTGEITLTSVALAVGATASVASASMAIASLASGGPKAPTVNMPAAPPASQAAQVPTAQATLQSTTGAPAAGPGGSNASTLLTGGQGVDPSKLSLGKTSLLGS